MIVGISGPSGSGKTTIARALRQVYAAQKHLCPSVQILHQDDFYRPEKDIPSIETRAGKVVNWDCPEAVDMRAFVQTLESYRLHGAFPEDLQADLARCSKEDRNDTGDTGVSEAVIDHLLEQGRIPAIQEPLLIVDGFMLYQSAAVLKTLDIAVLLRGSFDKLKARREARSGYVTLEGFWKDPEGYFPDCVWPEYVATHKQFFADQDVHGEPIVHDTIAISEQVDMNLDESFEFVTEVLRRNII